MNLIPLWVHHFGKRTAWSHICQFVQFSVHKSYTARKITLLSNGNFEENMDLSCIYLAVHPTFFTALNFNGIESIPLNTTLWSLTSCKDSRLVAASQKGLGSRCFIQLAKQLAAVCFKANCKGNCHLKVLGQKSWQFFCSYFGRNDDFINSFWNCLTFRKMAVTALSTNYAWIIGLYL